MSQKILSATVDFSPVRLSYLGALRGMAPRAAGQAFTYATDAGSNIEQLLCLAASNPEGTFYGLIPSWSATVEAQNMADMRGVTNIHFLSGTWAEQLAKDPGSPTALPMLDYLCVDETLGEQTSSDRNALYNLAAAKLTPNGLFVLRYRAYADTAAAMRFLAHELSPQMDQDQAMVFLQEIKSLNPTLFQSDAALQKSWNEAVAKNTPDLFFSSLAGDATSGTFAVMEGLLPRGLSFVGDAAISANYMELSTPYTAHNVLISCHDHLFYEIIKDFAMNRLVRNDIWCRKDAAVTQDVGLRFGPFAFGIITPRADVPEQVVAHDKIVPLTNPLMTKLINLMTQQPFAIGDFLHHADGKDEDPDSVLESIQTLVALGIATPMRSGFTSNTPIDTAHPAWPCAYNRSAANAPITSDRIILASAIVGNPVTISARDALVLQAITRVGLAGSVDALYPEMVRMAMNPDLLGAVSDGPMPTPGSAKLLVETTIESTLVRWYAYGLLAA